jgi:hypothetical protein
MTAASGAAQVPAPDPASRFDDAPTLRHADIHRRPGAAHKRAVVNALRAFDPPGLLNPGKAVPTLTRCAEFGRMHVRHGQLPFPGLERG